MSVPNQISIGRLLLVPGIVACLIYYHPSRDWLRYVALGLFGVGIVSDALDGFLARLQRQQTELGTLLDPIADKALILGTLISCSVIHGLPDWMRIPAWFNLLVISRDILLVVGSVILFAMKGHWRVQPSWLGKTTTAAQMLVIAAVLLGWPVRMPLIICAAMLTVLSGLSYIRLGVRALG